MAENGNGAAARATLKGAIAARDDATGRVEAARAAIGRIEDQLHEGWRRLNAARAAAAEDAHARVQRIVGGGSAVLELNGRAREADIEEEIVALKAARDLVRGELADAERSLGFKEHKVVDAVGAVLATAAGKLIAEAEAARKTFEGKVGILRFIRSSLGDEARRRVDAVSAWPTSYDVPDNPLLGKWLQASEALSKNADAPLPE